MPASEWIMLFSQLPATPSSLRVMLWRRMRAAGAVSMHNGVWVLPFSPKNELFMNEILAYVQGHGGNASVFVARALTPDAETGLIAGFTKNMDQDYAEFIQEAAAFLEELKTEIEHKDFTFADLDENEAELQKLTSWMRKIRARDYLGNAKAQEAVGVLESCRQMLRSFARSVYVNEGIDVPESEIEYRDDLSGDS